MPACRTQVRDRREGAREGTTPVLCDLISKAPTTVAGRARGEPSSDHEREYESRTEPAQPATHPARHGGKALIAAE